MHRPVDAGHAAPADALDDRVRPQEEALGVSAAEDGGLVLAEVAVVGQPAGEGGDVAVARLALPALGEVADLFRRQKPVAGQGGGETFNALLLGMLNASGPHRIPPRPPRALPGKGATRGAYRVRAASRRTPFPY